MQSELKTCPFCGSADHLRVVTVGVMTSDMPDRPHRVVCYHIDHDDVQGPVAYGRAESIAAWNTRASDDEIARLTEALRKAEEREKALRGTVQSLINLVIDAGVTDDLVAQVFPNMKRKNGQPASDFAKNARRTVNDARAALKENPHADA